MKKFIIILAVIVTILSINKEEKVVIPKDAIRFRVIANSNKEEDQTLKKQVVSNLNTEIQKLSFVNKNLLDSRENIRQSIPDFKKSVQETLEKNHSEETFTVDYGIHHFPKKEYRGIIYEEGDYESLVITLGNGLGENFWCVLFPPLCLLDTNEPTEDVEYTSFVKELVDKYF